MSEAIVVGKRACAFAVFAFAFFLSFAVRSAYPATNWTVVGWNNLGMHCMDADYSVFSILPPYNTVNAQLIDPTGLLVTNGTGLSLTYQAVADPSGSINTTSQGKTDFWDFVLPIFGAALPVDVGLPVPGPNSFAMPGSNNVAQAMAFDNSAAWFAAYGIPLTPYDDSLNKNAYPMMRLVAKDSGGATLGILDVVLPVSDEMDCRACHASGSGDAAKPAGGWVNDANPQRDYRLNILRLHDEKQAADATFQSALVAKGFSTNGLYAMVTVNTNPLLCAACHLSEALPNTGLAGIKPLTEAMHGNHATVIDPTNGLTLDASDNRSACYRCHPGSTTRCLRGAMGNAVASDGSMAMQCQSCHGSMAIVGASTRTGWLQEPNCQACHSGTAASNSGQIRYLTVFDSPGHMRQPADQTFATNPDMPASGLSLFRFSRGHGGLYCEACHGSTHAEFPSSHDNDNVQSIQHQGHIGVFVECSSCHATVPATVTGGPHGLHPVGQSWVSSHADTVEGGGAAQCGACHGLDYRGTVLSRSQADRTISAFGTKNFWRGFQIGCYTCHNGPGSESANKNHPAVVNNAVASTSTNTPVAIPLSATDADGNTLTLCVVSQARHGTVGLVGTAATYYPEAGYVGGDSFTFAAWDGQTDSNLGTVQITVGSGGCSYVIAPTTATVSAFAGSGSVTVTAAAGCLWAASSGADWITVTSGGSGSGNGVVKYSVAPNTNAVARMGTMTIAGHTFTVTQTFSDMDLTGQWVSLTQTCKGAGSKMKCSLKGQFNVQYTGSAAIPSSIVAFYLSNDGTLEGSDTLLKQYRVSKLKPNQTAGRKLSVKLPNGVSASGAYVIALVDVDDTVPDVDDTNNAISFGPLP
jgi:hypothetical protein